MRGMRTKLMAWALALLGLAALSTSASAQNSIILGLTNQVWRYNQTATPLDDGAWKAFNFNDTQAPWESGRGVFAFENQAAVNPLTNTSLYLTYPGQASQTLTYYFRTRFNIVQDPSTLVLVSSNLIDDGMIIYINGTEAGRFNMPAGDATYATLAPTANPNGEGVFVRVPLSSASLQPGANDIAVEVHQNSATSSDIVFGMALHATVAFAPTISVQPVSTNVLEGRSATLSVTASAAPAPTYQWYLNFGPIPDATNATYTINNMDAAQAGDYHVNVSNPYGQVDSSIATVGLIEDVEIPVIVSATGSPLAPLDITVTFNESITGAIDTFFYAIDFLAGGASPSSVTAVAYNATSNQLILTLDVPLDPAQAYKIIINAGGSLQDYFGNVLPDGTEKRIVFPAVFRQDVAGYTGTQDAEIHSLAGADTALGGAAALGVDLDDTGIAQSLLRFDNIFGGSPGQVPLGSTINRATLRVYSTDAGSNARLLRMLVPWSEDTVTWNTMVNGIDETNNVETGVTDAIVNAGQDEAFDDIDVTQAVRDWNNGQNNYGWAMLSTGTDGWDPAASENGTMEWRPTLIVEYEIVISPCEIINQPTGVTVNEGSPFTLSVLARGSDLTYQWYRNNVAIPGANASSYTVNAALPTQNSGTYRVELQNNVPSHCVSANAIVTVTADPGRDHVVSATGNPDQTTITVVFDDRMSTATAQNTANYSLAPTLAVSSAVIASSSPTNTVVTLTTAARTVGVNYNLNVSNVRDDSEASNLITPNPTTLPLVQRVRILSFTNSVWKYDQNGTDLGTAWKDVGYADGGWLSGPGMFGLETAATLTNLYPALGVSINTPWALTNQFGSNKITYYVRTTFNWPYNPASSTFELRHITDDGAIFYINGAEAGRYNMTNAPVDWLTQALSAPTEGVIRSTNLTGFACGQNLIAVEIHQSGTASSDIVWGSELIATVPSFSTACPPRLSIVNNGNGTVTISWAPNAGILQQKDSLTGTWTDSPGTGNPRTITASAVARFYSLRQ